MTKKNILFYVFSLIFSLLILSVSSCRKDFSTIPSFGQLEFSRDTVFLDTIFTNIGSATYNLKVYNRGNNDITIPNIALERGTVSNYRLNVDGIPGKDFQNIDILAKDSIFIFIETTINFCKKIIKPRPNTSSSVKHHNIHQIHPFKFGLISNL